MRRHGRYHFPNTRKSRGSPFYWFAAVLMLLAVAWVWWHAGQLGPRPTKLSPPPATPALRPQSPPPKVVTAVEAPPKPPAPKIVPAPRVVTDAPVVPVTVPTNPAAVSEDTFPRPARDDIARVYEETAP